MARRPSLAIVTCGLYPELAPDDRVLPPLLLDEGLDPVIVRWDDESAQWPAFDGVLIRSPWDYYERPDEWRAWLDARAADGTRLLNPERVLRWNLDKRYLHDLISRGTPVVETVWLERGEEADLDELLADYGWERVVVKPAVSAGAYRTSVVSRADAGAHRSALTELLQDTDVMIQPFLDQIPGEGEWSLVFFDAEFSHALVKRPAPGDFRVQERHGGSSTAQEPPDGFLEQARDVIDRAAASIGIEPADFLYARVDGVREGDTLVLIELEVFEPVLFFATAPGSAARFASAVAHRLHAGV